MFWKIAFGHLTMQVVIAEICETFSIYIEQHLIENLSGSFTLMQVYYMLLSLHIYMIVETCTVLQTSNLLLDRASFS
jgi:hypothetical protein